MICFPSLPLAIVASSLRALFVLINPTWWCHVVSCREILRAKPTVPTITYIGLIRHWNIPPYFVLIQNLPRKYTTPVWIAKSAFLTVLPYYSMVFQYRKVQKMSYWVNIILSGKLCSTMNLTPTSFRTMRLLLR